MEDLPVTPRRRWWIVGLLSASIAINLVDRQVLSVVAPVLRQQLSLSNTQYSYIIFAFQLGMLLGQVPAGLFLDAVGARLGFIIIVLFWSVVNGLTGFSRGLAELIGLRFLLGLAECGNYSGGIKVVANLFGPEGRAQAGGIFNGGAQFGAVIAPPLVVLITVHWGWRAAFFLPSALGLFWLLPWIRIFPRGNQVQASVSGKPSERKARQSRVSMKALLRNRQMIGLMLLRATGGPLTSFYWYWLPEYLLHGRGMSLVTIGLVAWMPYLAGTVGNVSGGFFSGRLIKRGASTDTSRKVSYVIGAVLSSLSLTLPFIPSAWMAVAVICLIVFGNQWGIAIYIAMVGDLFPSEITATVNGIGGVADSGMGMITMLLTGIVIDHFSYFPVLIAAGILPVLSVLCIFFAIGKIALVDIRSFKAA
jgi:MFS transporter, ACS family, aldohexuronate transporter